MKDLKIVDYDPSKKGDKLRLETLLTDGYEVHSAHPLGGVLVFLLEKERKEAPNGSPTTKQQAYLCWAYTIPDKMLEQCDLSKQECSRLISVHKEKYAGAICNSKIFGKEIDILRNQTGEFEDDIPF